MQSNRQTVAQIMEGVKGATEVKKVANNTVRYRNSVGNIVIRLHNTDIITYHPAGNISLNSGGWRTPTTKSRMNDALHALKMRGITQSAGVWYIGGYVFVDGIVIREDGSIAPEYRKKGERAIKKHDLLKKKVDRYMLKVEKQLQSGDVIPYAGDCFFCLMHTQENIPLGDACNDHGHIVAHVKEGYVPKALIWNAITELGYKPQYHLSTTPSKSSMKRTVAYKSVKKYVMRRLELAV